MLERPAFQIPPAPIFICDDCGAEGATIASSRKLCPECAETHLEQARQRKQAERLDRIREHANDICSGLERRFPLMAFWTLDTYPDDAAASEARKQICAWVDGYMDETVARNVFIYGPVGTGKTGLAWSAMHEWFELYPYEDIEFVNVRDLLAAARRSYSDPAAPDPLAGLAHPQLLVLDDLGAERPTEWALDAIATLVEGRYQQERSTFVTSNYEPARLIARLKPPRATDDIIGQRIVSRLVESCLQIRLDGADRRLKQAA